MVDVMIGDDLLKEQYPHLVNDQFQHLAQQHSQRRGKFYQKKAKISFKIIMPSVKKRVSSHTLRLEKNHATFLSSISYSSVSDADIIDRNFLTLLTVLTFTYC